MKSAKSVLVSLLVLSAVGQAEGAAAKHRRYVAGGWNVLETDNFRFCSRGTLSLSDRLLETAERMRQNLAEQWLGDATVGEAWSPKCDIILHSTSDAYLRAVPGGEQTVGSSLINTSKGCVTGRRIDIRADRSGWLYSAFGHELTHVVLADRFPDGRLPAWADEGMAVLADPSTKQDAHYRDLRLARSHKSAFRLVELFALSGYPSADRQAAFYGQSASLVGYLVGRGTPEQFVRFLGIAADAGYESAVRDVYGLQGVRDLERRWLQQVNVSDSLADGSPKHRQIVLE